MLSLSLQISDTRINGTLATLILERRDGALVVGTIVLRDECAEPITLEVGYGCERGVDRELLVVDTQAVTVSVWVREQTRLEDRISRSFDVGNGVRR